MSACAVSHDILHIKFHLLNNDEINTYSEVTITWITGEGFLLAHLRPSN